VAGGQEFDRGKFEELIVYLARRLPPEAALGRVKLAKLLMHSDFTAYARTGRSITGATYVKWEHGHLPEELILAEKDLGDEGDGSIGVEEVDYYGKPLKHITARRDPNLATFDEEELAATEEAIRLYGFESASYLSKLSHRTVGWRLADWKKEIPYNTFYLGFGGVSERDIRRGEELASLHGWS
jgi:hypothetical protein